MMMRHYSAVLHGKKTCKKCGETKKIYEFTALNALKTHHRAVCKPCETLYNRALQRKRSENPVNEDNRRQAFEVRKAARRDFIRAYLREHPCVDCGCTNVDVLEFDHVRGDKKYNVSHMVAAGRSIEDIKMEILKCDVRCRNCHMIRTRKVTSARKAAGDFVRSKRRSVTSIPKPDPALIYVNAYSV